MTGKDLGSALAAKIRRLEQMAIHGRRALAALGEAELPTLTPETLSDLERELGAQEELAAQCRRLDADLPQTRQQWQDWLDGLSADGRPASREALDRLEAALRQAGRVEADVQQRLAGLRDKARPRLERIRAGHRVLKAYAGARPNIPRILDREG